MADRLGAVVLEGSKYISIISSFRQSALISALSSQVHKSFNPKEALSEENLHGA